MIAAQATGGLLSGFFVTHPALNPLKITFAYTGIPLFCVHTTTGAKICTAWSGNLNVRLNLMVKAQIFVDVGGCRFTGRNGADDRGRTGDAVASGKYPFHIRDLCTGIGSQGSASLDPNTAFL